MCSNVVLRADKTVGGSPVPASEAREETAGRPTESDKPTPPTLQITPAPRMEHFLSSSEQKDRERENTGGEETGE